MEVVVLNDIQLNYLWRELSSRQMIFHPLKQPTGELQSKDFFLSIQESNLSVILDRNLLIALLDLCRNGTLKNQSMQTNIALIMCWATMYGISLSSGLAIEEVITQGCDSDQAGKELRDFFEIIDSYPVQTWINIATQKENSIATLPAKRETKKLINDFFESNDHLLMNTAAMIRIATLYRDESLSSEEKVMRFLSWYAQNLLACQYIIVYVFMLFTNQEGMKPSRNINSKDINKIVQGCQNQAWDFTYLSLWSTLYSQEEEMGETYYFATADNMLKKIFINSHDPSGLDGLVGNIYKKEQVTRIARHYNSLFNANRVKPDFGTDPECYFLDLIRREKILLMNSILA